MLKLKQLWLIYMLDKNSQVQHCGVNNYDIRHEKYVEVVNEIVIDAIPFWPEVVSTTS